MDCSALASRAPIRRGRPRGPVGWVEIPLTDAWSAIGALILAGATVRLASSVSSRIPSSLATTEASMISPSESCLVASGIAVTAAVDAPSVRLRACAELIESLRRVLRHRDDLFRSCRSLSALLSGLALHGPQREPEWPLALGAFALQNVQVALRVLDVVPLYTRADEGPLFAAATTPRDSSDDCANPPVTRTLSPTRIAVLVPRTSSFPLRVDGARPYARGSNHAMPHPTFHLAGRSAP